MLPTRSWTGWRCCAVDPRERLKRYLEQRKELGERELVLDGMTVEEVMKIVGAKGALAPRRPRAEAAPRVEPALPADASSRSEPAGEDTSATASPVSSA